MSKLKVSFKGLALSELMIAAAILAFVLAGLLLVFINCVLLNDLNRNFILAYSAVQTKMEELKDESFDDLDSHDAETFVLTGFTAATGKGRIKVEDEGASNLKRVTIAGCFMNRNRLIGDNIDNCQSSPVELITLIAR